MQRIDLGSVEHVVHRWWIRGQPGEIGHAAIGLGQTIDGTWFAARAEHGRNQAWAAHSERQACDAVTSWIRRRGGPGMWQELKQAAEHQARSDPSLQARS